MQRFNIIIFCNIIFIPLPKDFFDMGVEEVLRRHTITFDRSKVRILTQTYKFNGEHLPLALALCRNDINFVSDVSKSIRLKLKNAIDRTPVSYYNSINNSLDLIYSTMFANVMYLFPFFLLFFLHFSFVFLMFFSFRPT